MATKVWHELSPTERGRTYVYAGGDRLTFKNVGRVSISDSGTHYLETADGLKHIVASGWRAIELDVDGWTF